LVQPSSGHALRECDERHASERVLSAKASPGHRRIAAAADSITTASVEAGPGAGATYHCLLASFLRPPFVFGVAAGVDTRDGCLGAGDGLGDSSFTSSGTGDADDSISKSEPTLDCELLVRRAFFWAGGVAAAGAGSASSGGSWRLIARGAGRPKRLTGT
jgi:hypothetical protein